jgi:hypothetical protein
MDQGVFDNLPIRDWTTIQHSYPGELTKDQKDTINKVQIYLMDLDYFSTHPKSPAPYPLSDTVKDEYIALLKRCNLLGGFRKKSRKNKRRNRKSRRY